MMSTKKILIPVLAAAGIMNLSTGLDAQVRVTAPKAAESAKGGREATAKELLKLSAKLRREGQTEVAKVLRDQARRLLRGDAARGDARAGDGLRERSRDRRSDEARERNRDAVRARADAARVRSEKRRAEAAKRRAEQVKKRQDAARQRNAEARKRNAEARKRSADIKKRIEAAQKRRAKAKTDRAPGTGFRVLRNGKTGEMQFLDAKTGKVMSVGKAPGFTYRWNQSIGKGAGKGGLFLAPKSGTPRTPKLPKAPKPPKAPKVFYMDKDGMQVFVQPPKVDVKVEMDGKTFWTGFPKVQPAPEARKALKARKALAAPRTVRTVTRSASAGNLEKRVKELTSEVAKIRKLLERMHKDADKQERRRLLR